MRSWLDGKRGEPALSLSCRAVGHDARHIAAPAHAMPERVGHGERAHGMPRLPRAQDHRLSSDGAGARAGEAAAPRSDDAPARCAPALPHGCRVGAEPHTRTRVTSPGTPFNTACAACRTPGDAAVGVLDPRHLALVLRQHTRAPERRPRWLLSQRRSSNCAPAGTSAVWCTRHTWSQRRCAPPRPRGNERQATSSVLLRHRHRPRSTTMRPILVAELFKPFTDQSITRFFQEFVAQSSDPHSSAGTDTSKRNQ